MNAISVSKETVKKLEVRRLVEVFLVVIFTLIMNALDAEIDGLKVGDGDLEIGNDSEVDVRDVERERKTNRNTRVWQNNLSGL
jgi:hypothetical protein